ncbi:MAG TPA: transporter substrate-binding domain-containing protein [Candidatus Cybelea sp.]|nr:transporter substrate-binding domain-containing protein [Candidatus Cybelea sp.]
MRRGIALGLLLAMIGVAREASAEDAQGGDALILYYHERPPYSAQQPDGSVRGITADIAAAALQAAGVAFRWTDLPSARQMEVIRRGETRVCGLGWFKTTDREAFAKFSGPIYHDRPSIVVARADDQRFAGTPTIDALFGNKALTLLTKTGYSYGAELDQKIASEAPTKRTDASDNRTMLGMISHARVDYMIMAEEEAKDLLGQADITQWGLAIYPLQNAPAGELRYLMCSKAVPDEVIRRIDEKLPQVE